MNLSISNKILLGKLVPENQWLETWSHLEMKETLKQSFNVLRFQGQFSGLNNTPWKTNITFSHLKLSQKPPKKSSNPSHVSGVAMLVSVLFGWGEPPPVWWMISLGEVVARSIESSRFARIGTWTWTPGKPGKRSVDTTRVRRWLGFSERV